MSQHRYSSFFMLCEFFWLLVVFHCFFFLIGIPLPLSFEFLRFPLRTFPIDLESDGSNKEAEESKNLQWGTLAFKTHET